MRNVVEEAVSLHYSFTNYLSSTFYLLSIVLDAGVWKESKIPTYITHNLMMGGNQGRVMEEVEL